jgi:predicted ArsR family transcriptional regulator
MQAEIVPSDVAILDILRKQDSATVAELAACMQVTSTAIRQRLTRLMAQGHIDRVTVRAGRGRPSHRYVLTKQGRRKTGSNFADLATALWHEIREISDVEVRRGLLQRVAKRLADEYRPRIRGETMEERMDSLAELFAQLQIPFEVDGSGDLPILTALACPYPDLAEQDRSICSMERMLFSELLDDKVRLAKCRLDGDQCCTFSPLDDPSGSDPARDALGNCDQESFATDSLTDTVRPEGTS